MALLEEIFAEVLDVDPSTLDGSSSPATIPNWDSMAGINIITELEDRYSMTLTSEEIQKMLTIADVRAILAARGIEV